MRAPMPEFYGSTVVSDKGQVVIPSEARSVLGLEKGERLLVMVMNEEAIMLVRPSSFEKMAAEMTAKVEMIKSKVTDGDR